MSWIKYVAVGVASFAAGIATGYFIRKKTEVQFEEISQEEMDELSKDIGFDQDEKEESEEPKESKESEKTEESKDIEEKKESKPKAIDTQKEQYFKYWKGNNTSKYDTRTSEEPEDPVISDDGLDEEFINEINEDDNLPDVEFSDLDEFIKYAQLDGDGEYDAFTMYWYSKDDVTLDVDEELIDDPSMFGFDIATMFQKHESEHASEDDYDPNMMFVKENNSKTIYQIIRRRASYSKMKEQEEYGGSSTSR